MYEGSRRMVAASWRLYGPEIMALPSIDELKRKQTQFVIDRLSSDETAFRADVTRAIEALLATPLENVLDAARFEAAIDTGLAKEQIERGARPLSRAIHMAIVRSMRADATKLGAF